MTQLGYIIAGWSVTFGVLAVYAFVLLSRGRALAAEVSADRRRWMTTASASDPSTEVGV